MRQQRSRGTPTMGDISDMKDKIEKTLSVLVGSPWWAIGRAADLARFAFGNRRTVKGSNGVEKEVGDYALHVQCPWRMTLKDEIITGRGDIFCTPEESAEPIPPDFDWQEGNRFDRIVEQVVAKSLPLTVRRVEAANAGSFTILLEHGYELEIFPYDSETEEHWRFFKPSTEEPHFVVSGKGLSTE